MLRGLGGSSPELGQRPEAPGGVTVAGAVGDSNRLWPAEHLEVSHAGLMMWTAKAENCDGQRALAAPTLFANDISICILAIIKESQATQHKKPEAAPTNATRLGCIAGRALWRPELPAGRSWPTAVARGRRRAVQCPQPTGTVVNATASAAIWNNAPHRPHPRRKNEGRVFCRTREPMMS